MAEFRCKKTECENKKHEHIAEYNIKIRENEVRFFDKHDYELKCKVCGVPFERLPDKNFEGFGTNFLKFDSFSSSDKKQVLKKRANEAFQKNKDGMKDYRDFKESEKPDH